MGEKIHVKIEKNWGAMLGYGRLDDTTVHNQRVGFAFMDEKDVISLKYKQLLFLF